MSKGQQLEERRPRGGGRMSATPTIDAASSTATCSSPVQVWGNVWWVPTAEDKSRKANLSPGSLKEPTPRKVQQELCILCGPDKAAS